MPIQVDTTLLVCSFCAKAGAKSPLVRSMHGLYCTNEFCYSRVIGGNLVPPVECEKCKENAFFVEEDGVAEIAAYVCIACGTQSAVE